GFGPEEARGQLRRRVWFRRLVLPLARKVVVPSLVLEGHLRHTWRVPERARVVIRNGIDLDRFSPIGATAGAGSAGAGSAGAGSAGGREDAAAARARRDELRRQWGARADEVVIGTVARLRREKGLELLVESFAALL